MSLATFARKSAVLHKSTISASSPGGIWPDISASCCVQKDNSQIYPFGPVGFSLVGSRRSPGGVGRDMRMSKSGTPFRGQWPVGWGGTHGKYPSSVLVATSTGTGTVSNAPPQPVVQPVLNALSVITRGTQYKYIKPSTISTRGQINRRYPWIRHGQYPQAWVQPNYTGNLTDTASQQAYIEQKAANAVRELDVNDTEKYINAYVKCGPTLRRPGRSTAGFTYDALARNGPYAKSLDQPVNYGEYMAHRKRQCINPVGLQKPFPFAKNVGKGMSVSGARVDSFGSSCNAGPVYLTPPAWYTEG